MVVTTITITFCRLSSLQRSHLYLKDCKKTWHIIREQFSCLPDPLIVIIIHNHNHHLCLKDCKQTWHIIRERLSCLPDSEQFLQTVPVCPAGSSIHLQNDIVLFIKRIFTKKCHRDFKSSTAKGAACTSWPPATYHQLSARVARID